MKKKTFLKPAMYNIYYIISIFLFQYKLYTTTDNFDNILNIECVIIRHKIPPFSCSILMECVLDINPSKNGQTLHNNKKF